MHQALNLQFLLGNNTGSYSCRHILHVTLLIFSFLLIFNSLIHILDSLMLFFYSVQRLFYNILIRSFSQTCHTGKITGVVTL